MHNLLLGKLNRTGACIAVSFTGIAYRGSILEIDLQYEIESRKDIPTREHREFREYSTFIPLRLSEFVSRRQLDSARDDLPSKLWTCTSGHRISNVIIHSCVPARGRFHYANIRKLAIQYPQDYAWLQALFTVNFM